MVPIYALNAWLGLIYPDHSIYMDSIRECYEAYVIYNFMKYLLNYLNLEMDFEANLEFKPPVRHIFPLCCLKDWEMGREFVHNCKHGILQYTVLRPLTTMIAVLCEVNGVYGEGTLQAGVAYPYILAVNNVSQAVAMYCLVMFYRANLSELKPMKPLPKFLCIKAVVFFSFFQGVIITFLVHYGFIADIFAEETGPNPKLLAIKLQDFLICIEMFFAAMAHKYAFPHEPFHINVPNYDYDQTRRNGWLRAFLTMIDISDVTQDVGDHFNAVGSSLSRRFRGRNSYRMTRGSTSEAEYLVPPQLGYQSSMPKHGYGATESKHMSIATRHTPPIKDEGFTAANHYSINYPSGMVSSQISDMTTSYSSNTGGASSTLNDPSTTTSGNMLAMSDSQNSGLSSHDDYVEIRVKPKMQDQITFNNV